MEGVRHATAHTPFQAATDCFVPYRSAIVTTLHDRLTGFAQLMRRFTRLTNAFSMKWENHADEYAVVRLLQLLPHPRIPSRNSDDISVPCPPEIAIEVVPTAKAKRVATAGRARARTGRRESANYVAEQDSLRTTGLSGKS